MSRLVTLLQSQNTGKDSLSAVTTHHFLCGFGGIPFNGATEAQKFDRTLQQICDSGCDNCFGSWGMGPDLGEIVEKLKETEPCQE